MVPYTHRVRSSACVKAVAMCSAIGSGGHVRTRHLGTPRTPALSGTPRRTSVRPSDALDHRGVEPGTAQSARDVVDRSGPTYGIWKRRNHTTIALAPKTVTASAKSSPPSS